MKQLQNGYFVVTKEESESSPLKVELFAPVRNEPGSFAPLSSFECEGWDDVRSGILATIQAANGKFAIVVDDTRQNIAKETIYYRLSADGKLKQFVPTKAEEVLLETI